MDVPRGSPPGPPLRPPGLVHAGPALLRRHRPQNGRAAPGRGYPASRWNAVPPGDDPLQGQRRKGCPAGWPGTQSDPGGVSVARQLGAAPGGSAIRSVGPLRTFTGISLAGAKKARKWLIQGNSAETPERPLRGVPVRCSEGRNIELVGLGVNVHDDR